MFTAPLWSSADSVKNLPSHVIEFHVVWSRYFCHFTFIWQVSLKRQGEETDWRRTVSPLKAWLTWNIWQRPGFNSHMESRQKITLTQQTDGCSHVDNELTGKCLRFLPGLANFPDFSSGTMSMSSIVLSPCEKKTTQWFGEMSACNSAKLFGRRQSTTEKVIRGSKNVFC